MSALSLSHLGYNVAHYYFEAPGLDAGTFQVVRFRGTEGLSKLFAFELKLLSEDPDIDFSSIVNQPAVFTIMRGQDPVPVAGIVTDFAQIGRSPDHVAYEAILRPRLWRLSLSYQSRIFQNLLVEEILREVFDEAGFTSDDVRFDLSQGGYEPREYCVQYQETDLDFVHRLMEHEGLYYFFEHDEERDVLVITDHRSTHEAIPDPSDVYYHSGDTMVGEREEVIYRLMCREQIVTGQVRLKDYNYRTPETSLLGESQLNGDMPGTRYEYGEHFLDASQGQRLARVRNEEIECRRRVLQGKSGCVGLRSGYVFKLERHFREDWNEEYLVTGVTHQGRQGGDTELWWSDGETAEQDEFLYRNEFTCIPVDVQFRPLRTTPKPKVPGIMTARIESAGGDYAYIDDKGCYRAEMHFDTSERPDGTATLPIRMNQPYSGPGYGMHFPNHGGTEMIWACENGDIDRPVALGTIPNPSNESPATSENRMQNVIRTWGKNELTFDDTSGSENIYLHGTKDWTIEIANDKNQTVGRDWTIEIANDKNQTVGSNELLTVVSNREKIVGGDQTEQVSGNKAINVEGNHTETISGNMSQAVSSAKSETIALAKALSIGAGYQVSVVGAENHTVGGLLAQEVGAAKIVAVGLASNETVGKTKSVSAGNNISHKAGDDVSLQSGKKMVFSAGDDLAISGKKKGVIEVADQLVLKCGKAQIVMKKNGDIMIKGNKITIKGSGDVKIKGSKSAIN